MEVVGTNIVFDHRKHHSIDVQTAAGKSVGLIFAECAVIPLSNTSEPYLALVLAGSTGAAGSLGGTLGQLEISMGYQEVVRREPQYCGLVDKTLSSNTSHSQITSIKDGTYCVSFHVARLWTGGNEAPLWCLYLNSSTVLSGPIGDRYNPKHELLVCAAQALSVEFACLGVAVSALVLMH